MRNAPPLPLLLLGAVVLLLHAVLLQRPVVRWQATGELPLVVTLRQPLPEAGRAATADNAAPAAPAPAPTPASTIGRPQSLPASPSAPVSVPKVPTEQAQSAPPAINSVAIRQPVEAAPAPPATTTSDATPASTFQVPQSARLVFDVTGQNRQQPFSGTAQLLWRQDGNQYEARLEADRRLPLRPSQHSVGRVGSDGLQPQRFAERARSQQATHFERDRGLLVFSSNAAPAALLPGAQDRLSVWLQLGALLAARPTAFAPGAVISLQTAGTRDAPAWSFVVAGPQTLQLPAGPMATLKLSRAAADEYDQAVEIWLAPSLGWLPVRLRLAYANGDFVDHQWRGATENPDSLESGPIVAK